MARWRTRHRGARAERGAAAVEFAIVLTVLLLILLGIIDFGRLLFVSQAVKSASREGARTAVINGNTGADVFNSANNSANAAASLSAGGAPMRVAATSSAPVTYTLTSSSTGVTNSQLCPGSGPVTVAVSIDFRWLTPLGALPGLSSGGLQGTRTVNSSTTMRCE